MNSELFTSPREEQFPVTRDRIFLAHAGVTALPAVATEAMVRFAQEGSREQQEHERVWAAMGRARHEAAKLLGADAGEIALLGPTALGLNLVANGLEWRAGDEVLYYQDDYPANVYPWIKLRAQGVKVIALAPGETGVIRWEDVESKLTDKTRLVALASASFLSGYRVNLARIGRKLKEYNAELLFCVDGIQTLGAFEMPVEHIDFLSADSHKWMLGPMGAGIFYVKQSRFPLLRPTLLGSWNVVSPGFIAQDEIDFYDGGRRYEPGSLNLIGNAGMLASMEMLNRTGVPRISARIREVGRNVIEKMREAGFSRYVDFPDVEEDGHQATCGIYTFTNAKADFDALQKKCKEARVDVSWRVNRKGTPLLRVSPHYYNSEEDIARLLEVLTQA